MSDWILIFPMLNFLIIPLGMLIWLMYVIKDIIVELRRLQNKKVRKND